VSHPYDGDLQIGRERLDTTRRPDSSAPRAPLPEEVECIDLLAVRIGSEPYALRLSDLCGVFPRREILALPSPVPELLGLTALRGAIVPIYDLGMLLGYPAGEVRSMEAFVLAADHAVGFAFERVDGELRAPLAHVFPADPIVGLRNPLQETLRTAEFRRPIVRIATLLGSVRRRAQRHAHEGMQAPRATYPAVLPAAAQWGT
jgi:chemotaxis signal transduction protein